MNNIVREHLVSALQTFIATFLSALGVAISATGTLQWTWAFWSALLLAAVRAAVREVFAQYAPAKLGGRK